MNRATAKGKSEEFVKTYGSYTFSKVILIALSLIQQRQLSKDSRKDLLLSAVCPGYVKTDLNNNSGHLTTEQGAETPIYLALLPPNFDGPRGAFWAEKKPVEWTS